MPIGAKPYFLSSPLTTILVEVATNVTELARIEAKAKGINNLLVLTRSRSANPKTIGRKKAVQAVLLITLGSVLVANFGALGTAIAVLTAGAVSAIIAVTYTLHIVGRQQLWPLMTHAIAAAITLALHITFAQAPLTSLSPLAQVFAGSTFVGIVYVTAYLALSGRRSFEHIRYLRNRAR